MKHASKYLITISILMWCLCIKGRAKAKKEHDTEDKFLFSHANSSNHIKRSY